ncbi:LysM peptidoglycan-binding domain-containing protein [Mangrovimonas sp. YM274]|uniref:PBP1 and LysM peptidoglycan-binding domain-containing protein n=1 Tax=Mangrovimonas sp. YM274 TaxID=3070660 RepID=UPI0027DE934C|nr:LysM peptidoglycan-binding domain-containing protein [Mangrovimonas sp. YM274]WMI69801.1 LysM peptidoglycan-binding domain-containing protein [Mangrovimonas sp. YM274]
MKKLVLITLFTLASICFVQAQNFKQHKVKQGETIEEIAKLYLVTPFDIYALNPDAKKKLSVGTVLIIPTSKIRPDEAVTETKEVTGYQYHRAKKKETLYSIAKQYNVSVDDIKKYNTYLYANNLKKGDKIKIPKFKTVVTKAEVSNTLKKYTVQPKEGKWRVAYKFGITVPELEALNPNMGEVLQPGDVLNVPNIADNEEKAIEENYNYYTVQKSEGYMALNRKFGVTQEELEALNPELKEGGLKLGMVIKIPGSANAVIGGDEFENTDLTKTNFENLKTKRLALMLPYRLNRIDVDSVQEAKSAIKNDTRLSISLDFHVGVEMALDSAKQLGISTNLKVFDTRDQLSEVSNILKNNDFSTYDAIIGPLFPKNLERVAASVKGNHIPVISPFTAPENLYDNVFQTVPSNELMQKEIIRYVKNDSMPKHIVIIADSKNTAVSNQLKSEFVAARQIFSRKDKDGKDSNYILISDLEDIFLAGENIVFLETKNEAFASNVTSMLNGLNNEEHQIVLMTTQNSSVFEGKNISNYHLSNLKFTYPSANKTLATPTTNGFITKYKSLYGVEPNKYAIRGFDLTLDILLRLASKENLYEAATPELETEYLENKFRYTKKYFGGYFNEAVYIVKYDDLTIVEAK